MGSGLQKQLVPVFNAGGIDTKSDPRLVPASGPGSLLELENMYMLRNGELRLRNGFAKLATQSAGGGLDRFLGSAQNLYTTAQGGLATVSRLWAGTTKQAQALKYALSINPPAPGGWEPSIAGAGRPYASARAAIRGIEASATASATVNLDGPDHCITQGAQLVTWIEDATSSGLRGLVRELATGKISRRFSTAGSSFGIGLSNGRAPVVCAGGAYPCFFQADDAGTPSLVASRFSASFAALTTLALNGVSAAQPWIDAKPIPGGNLIAVAYRANAGGVSLVVFDPVALAVTVGPVNIAGADASFCLGWLDDSLSTGNVYLATAGSTSGVVVRTLNPATMAVTATNVIDATATAGIRNITGHINTSATNYVVLWDQSGSSPIYDKIKAGRWTGSAAVADLAPSFSLYSRSALFSDGLYYVMGLYNSAVQPTLSFLGTNVYAGVGGASPICHVMSGEAGGARAQCSLSSPAVTGGVVILPATRKRRITTPGSSAVQGGIIQQIEISDGLAAFRHPRELGGTMFVPGGILNRDDGVAVEQATFHFYPEAPTMVPSATGSMTAAGAYLYRIIYSRKDAIGRVSRSAGSVPAAVTLGGGDGRVTLTLQNPRMPISDQFQIIVEVYRAGPAAAGATGYNKVGEVLAAPVLGGDTLTFIDTMSDVAAATGETAYFTGNVLENFLPPSHNLLEVNGGRVGVVSAEDSTEFWPSKEYKPGAGIGFNPLLAIRVTGDGYGAITALAAMDGRWIIFKSSAIYVISGDGPNDVGQGGFNAPQAVSLSIGTTRPGSVVATPDGIMFQSSVGGVYLLSRGLALTYVGAPVEKYTLSEALADTTEDIVDASLAAGTTQVRFVQASGRCLVWDFHHKMWCTFQLRVDTNGVASTVVACANPPTGWCYALADGSVMQETLGIYSDVNVTTTAIVPRIGFPQVNLAGLNGFQRVYAVELEGEYVGDHTLQVSAVYDLGVSTEPTRSKAITAGPYQYETMLASPKCSTVQITLTAALAAGSGAFRLSGMSLLVGIKRGSVIPYTKRLT